MKKLIILLVILLVLAGAGAAAWWFFLRPQDGAPVEEEAPPPPVLTQIDLPLMSIPIVRSNRSMQRVDFLVTVVFDDPEKQKKIEERLPRLTDAILTELQGLLPRKMVEQSNYERALLEERLNKMAAARFGKGTIHQIYIKDMQIYK